MFQDIFFIYLAAELCKMLIATAVLMILAVNFVGLRGGYRIYYLLQCNRSGVRASPVLHSPQNIFPLITQIASAVGGRETRDQFAHMPDGKLCC